MAPSVKPKDVVIPIVYPDYKIAVGGRSIPYLGHAGVLLIDGRGGGARYFEYGRYKDPAGVQPSSMGRVREHTPPAVSLASDGHATKKSLEATLASVARFSTSHASYRRIEGAYACVPGAYAKMLSYAMARKAKNHDPDRLTYWTLFNNCMTFTQQTMAMGGALTRSGTIPSPADWIEDVRDDYPDLDFDANSGTVTVNYGSIFQPMFSNGSLPSWAVYKGFFRSTFEGDNR